MCEGDRREDADDRGRRAFEKEAEPSQDRPELGAIVVKAVLAYPS